MVNYQDGKIYRIVSNRDDEIFYVGSTTKKYLSQRMDTHRSCYKSWKNGKGYKVTVYDLFEKYGIENCSIELLQLAPCNSKDELTKKEGEYIRVLNCVNKVKPNRTPLEKKIYHQIYYKHNKTRFNQSKKTTPSASGEPASPMQHVSIIHNKQIG